MSVPEMQTGSSNSSTTAAAMNQAYVASAIQSIRPEYSIASARASVLTYDDSIRKWIPRGTSSGLSKVHIYQNRFQHTFRVVGRKLDDHEVVINCLILKDLKYIKATPTFHQWRESQSIYGLNFKSKEDADIFANAMDNALESLNNNVINDNCSKSTSSLGSSTAAVAEEDMRYRSMTREEAQNYQDKCQFIHESHNNHNNNISHHQSNGGGSHYRVSSICNASIPSSITSSQSSLTSLTAASTANASISCSNNNNSHNQNATDNLYSAVSDPNRTTASAAPTPTNTSLAPPIAPSGQAGGPSHATPAPPLMPATSSAASGTTASGASTGANCRAPPPPPPPPPMPSMLDALPNGSDSNATSMLALQLQNAKLKKQSNAAPAKPTASAMGSSAVPPSASNGMASMMDEITKTIARRRAAVEKNDSLATNGTVATAGSANCGSNNNWEKSSTLPNQGKHFESPKSIRKRFGNSAQQQPENGTMPKPAQLINNGYNTITKSFGSSAAAVASGNGGGNSSESSSSSLLVNSQQNSSDSDLKTAEIICEIKKEMHKIKLEIIDALRQELNRR